MRRYLGWTAFSAILLGTGLVALGVGDRPLGESIDSLLALLAPSPAQAAPRGRSQRDEIAAYYQADPAAPQPVEQTSGTAPATSSRRTQLDSHFEDMSLSLSEDEPNAFREEMGPAPTAAPLPVAAPAAAQEPSISFAPTPAPVPDAAVQLTPAPEESLPPAAAEAMPPSNFEPTPAAMPAATDTPAVASDVALEATPAMPMEAALEPMPSAPIEAALEPTPAVAAPQERYADYPQHFSAPAPAAEASAVDAIEATPTPMPSNDYPPAESFIASEPIAAEESDVARPATEPTPAPFAEPQPFSHDAEVPIAPGAISTAPFATPPAAMATADRAHEATERKDQGAVAVAWLAPDEVNRGDEVNCRLQVTNTGSTPAAAVEVHVQLPDAVELVAASAEPTPQGRQLTWHIERLEARESKTFELRLRTSGDGDIAPSATVTFTRAAKANIHVLDPQLTLAIEGPDQALVSQPAVYQVRVSNPGTGRARNVVVQARLDERLSHPEGARLEYTIGTLGPGETRLLEVPVTGTSPGAANIVAQATSSERLSAQGGCVVEVVRPSLQLAIDGPKLRFIDRKAVFKITAHNPGAVAATNVQIYGSVPAGFRYEQSTAGGGYDEAQAAVAWFVGRLEPQQTVSVEYELVAQQLGPHHMAAAVRADLGVEERAELETAVDGVSSVALTVDGYDDPIEVGGQTTYHLHVTNDGTKAAHNVQVACRVPAEMEATDARGTTSPAMSGERVVFEPIAELAPGETQDFTVTVHCRKAGDVRFRAYFRSDECQEVVQQEALTRIYQD